MFKANHAPSAFAIDASLAFSNWNNDFVLPYRFMDALKSVSLDVDPT
jgi:hypothetical protein